MKRCKVCGQLLPLDAFYRMKGMRDGHRNDCKACNLAAKKRRYDANPQLAITRVKRWQQANAERHRTVSRQRRTRPEVKARERDTYLQRKFGITSEDYDRMLAEQEGCCAICRRAPNARIALHVDHEHGTGRVRGLLCFRCNNALGDFDDDTALLVKAIDYLMPPPTEEERRRIDAFLTRSSR